ncbi:MAG: TauD/TfdA family dioxygenase [Deltaproteobacteria bacterium]|jgi:taurine dioxygenase|nr:TauD/TfdA family dioxygenase [Deltaproteobacteria bacterium]
MTIGIEPVTGVIGATISGVDLREPLPAADRDAIEAALYEYGLLIFRAQDITPEQQVAFSKQFGEISLAPMAPDSDMPPELMVLDQVEPKGEGADNWHSDNTFMPEPPTGSILRAVKMPKVGGDTCYANAVAAYEALSPPMREFLEGLRALHDITKPMRRAVDHGIFEPGKLDEMAREWPPVEHPVIRTHPVTGAKALFVNGNSTVRILGLTDRESDLLLPFLNDHIRSPDFQCRLHWDENTIAFWDNRIVQHYAVPDYTEQRIMHRVTLTGEKPF